MSYGAQYARHTVVTVFTHALNGVLFYLLRIVLYQRLTPEDYGLFYAVMSFGLVLHPLLSLGFDPGLIPHVTRLRERGDTAGIQHSVLGALAPQGLIGVLVLGLVALFARPIATNCVGNPQAASVIRLVALHVGLLLVFKAGFGLLVGLQHINARNGAELTRVAVCLASAFVLLRRGWGIEAAPLAYVIGTAAAVGVEFVAVAVLRPELWRVRFRWRPELVRSVFRSGKYLSIAFGGVTVFSHMDTMMLTLIRGDFREVAAYQLAVPTVMILYTLLLASAANFLPMVTTMWQRGEGKRLGDGIVYIYQTAMVLVVPAAVVAACFSDVLMPWMFRRDVFNAPQAFNILAVGSVLYFMCYLNLHILGGIGQEREACKTILAALALNLVLNALLIYYLGLRGAATATVLSHGAATAIGFAVIRKHVPVGFRLALPLVGVAASIFLAALAYGVRFTVLFETYPVPASLLATAMLILAYACALEWLGLVRLRELTASVLRGVSTRERLPLD